MPSDGLEPSTPSLPSKSGEGRTGKRGSRRPLNRANRRNRPRPSDRARGRACPGWCSLHVPSPRSDDAPAREAIGRTVLEEALGRSPPVGLGLFRRCRDATLRVADEFSSVRSSNRTDAAPTDGHYQRGQAMQEITPCLWFDSEGEEAANFYTSVF